MPLNSRERRKTKMSEFAFEECDYKSSSKTLLKRHVESAHKLACDQYQVPEVQLWDLIETWGFRDDIKDVKGINNRDLKSPIIET